MRWLFAVFAILLSVGCRGEPQHHLLYLSGLPSGEEQRAAVCERNNDDRLANWYCAGAEAPALTSLDELLVALEIKDPERLDRMEFAITGQSTSIVARNATVLNPRAIVFSPFDELREDYVTLGYLRGEGFAEVIAHDTTSDSLNFYLVTYKTGCEPNCTFAERFLPSDERDWTNVSVYGDPDLANTVLDCLHCHVPDGGDTRRILRMQEFGIPWTHWFDTNSESHILLDAFLDAHEGEDYAGIPADRLSDADPALLESLLTVNGFSVQPNAYNGTLVNGDDPSVNTPNEYWLELYDNAVRGEAIAPPHYMINPYDEELTADYGFLYRRVRDGLSTPDLMPDLTSIFKDSEQRYLSFRPAAGLDAVGIVEHACGSCHDGRFPELSRDNFRVQDFPDDLTPEMRKNIGARLTLADHNRRRMPPLLSTQLSEAEVQLILDAL